MLDPKIKNFLYNEEKKESLIAHKVLTNIISGITNKNLDNTCKKILQRHYSKQINPYKIKNYIFYQAYYLVTPRNNNNNNNNGNHNLEAIFKNFTNNNYPYIDTLEQFGTNGKKINVPTRTFLYCDFKNKSFQRINIILSPNFKTHQKLYHLLQ